MTVARAMVELRRALQENSIVRESLLNARYEKQEVSLVRPLVAACHVERPAGRQLRQPCHPSMCCCSICLMITQHALHLSSIQDDCPCCFVVSTLASEPLS